MYHVLKDFDLAEKIENACKDYMKVFREANDEPKWYYMYYWYRALYPSRLIDYVPITVYLMDCKTKKFDAVYSKKMDVIIPTQYLGGKEC